MPGNGVRAHHRRHRLRWFRFGSSVRPCCLGWRRSPHQRMNRSGVQLGSFGPAADVLAHAAAPVTIWPVRPRIWRARRVWLSGLPTRTVTVSPTLNRGAFGGSRPVRPPRRMRPGRGRPLRERGVGVLEVALCPAVGLVQVRQVFGLAVMLDGVGPSARSRGEQVDRRVHLLDAVPELVDAEESRPEAHGEQGESPPSPIPPGRPARGRDHDAPRPSLRPDRGTPFTSCALGSRLAARGNPRPPARRRAPRAARWRRGSACR